VCLEGGIIVRHGASGPYEGPDYRKALSCEYQCQLHKSHLPANGPKPLKPGEKSFSDLPEHSITAYLIFGAFSLLITNFFRPTNDEILY
jgi:hypothetical protein